MSNKMPGCHLANAWRSRSKHILQWRYYTAMQSCRTRVGDLRLESTRVGNFATWDLTWDLSFWTWDLTCDLEIGTWTWLETCSQWLGSQVQVARKTKSLYNLSFDISIKYNFSISCSIHWFFSSAFQRCVIIRSKKLICSWDLIWLARLDLGLETWLETWALRLDLRLRLWDSGLDLRLRYRDLGLDLRLDVRDLQTALPQWSISSFIHSFNWLYFCGICQSIPLKLWSNTAQGCTHQSTCMPQLQPLCSAALVQNVLPRGDEGSGKPCAVIEAL